MVSMILEWGAAYAYSTMYQKIVEGYRNGTREVYVSIIQRVEKDVCCQWMKNWKAK